MSYARTPLVVTLRGMLYTSDLPDDQWDLLEPVFNAAGRRGRRHTAAGAIQRQWIVCADTAPARLEQTWRDLRAGLSVGSGLGA